MKIICKDLIQKRKKYYLKSNSIGPEFESH